MAVDEREGVGVGGGGGVSLGSGFGEDFFLGDEVGEGDADSFFAVVDFFRLCGVGVGVGVEKIFLIFSPTDSSAASGGECAKNAITAIATVVKPNGVTIWSC